MKFSYSLLKKMVPGIPEKKRLADVLSVKSFEVEEVKADAMEIKIMPNRWSDAASHWGMAREAAAATGQKLSFGPKIIINQPQNKGFLEKIRVEDPRLCPRYMAYYLEIPKIGESPVWMRKMLQTCGLRPVNAVVDILNYVMLETGQPLHAFDASKIKGGIRVRLAKANETMETIDNQRIKLDKSVLIIADREKPLAIAGIKGGESSKVGSGTKAIIVESANFDPVSIYKASKTIKLATDASQRFGHGLSPELCKIGVDRAAVLLKEICKATFLDSKDVYPKRQPKKILKLDQEKLRSVLGINIDSKTVSSILKSLGFRLIHKNMVEVPALRLDINIVEDLIEEVGRMYDLNKIPGKNPAVLLAPPEIDDYFSAAEKAKNSLVEMGFSEVRNSSFVPGDAAGDVEIENPLSDDKRFLRSNLIYHLRGNIKTNHRFLENVRIFEIGKVFLKGFKEEYRLAMAVGLKSGGHVFRELRGPAENLLRSLGLTDYAFVPEGDKLRLESDHEVLGYLFPEPKSKAAFLEIDFDKARRLMEGEREYLEISPYPSIIRDISFTVPVSARMNLILEAIADLRIENLEDVDLIDYLALDSGRISLTLRLVFQSMKKTLSDEQANRSTAKIAGILASDFEAEIR